ncbi:hypothetical protein N7509_009397 [Penicillium cosmopolitanum]|uniref:CipC-like antibiotic response protein n=1 Tax=Penicillium cosmopolitanum TaxID=1131564 RepID=A0A9X0B3M2_9EURO|nr:uncharacterized protein N7509_009397 [Penicillium cosmopolitanum]KAJ5386856.1 hypothetical protein N7509_009397 [Penicillium cosmopolitanum]
MGWFDNDSDESQHYENYQQYSQNPEEHKAKFSHELIGGAAAFEAMKAYEDHEARNGQVDNHARAKEIAAGLAGAFIDREFETKGLDFVDREKAKRHAEQSIQNQFEQSGRW